MNPTQPPVFGPIALSLSGGGYRAAAFHLGTLAYLHHLNLLRDVGILSTVSGGTLVGMKYALSLKEGEPFDKFYDDFYSFMRDVNLNKFSLQKIGDPAATKTLRYHDLVTAFAETYDERLLRNAKFGVFWDGNPIPLKEIIFNSTEFRTGIAFRFQKSQNAQAKIGNGNVSIAEDIAKQIRLADIAAASACFPGGFEPLAFPGDFSWPGDVIPGELKSQFKEQVALMDGGVYDNQGIDGVMNAVDRTGLKLGMFIISDTDKSQDNLYRFPKPIKKSWITLGLLNLLSTGFFWLSVITFFALVWEFWNHSSIGIGEKFFLYLFPALLSLSAAGITFWIRKTIKTAFLNKVPNVGSENVWKDIKSLSIDQVTSLAELRITSLFALASRVFMKRIRGLVYAQVYSDNKYKDIRVSNLIDDLIRPQKQQVAEILRPSTSMIKIATGAAAMPTTLWFDNQTQQDTLIACGQLTTCYNLLEFIIRKYGQDESTYPSAIRVLYRMVVEDWIALKVNPFSLFHKRS